MHSIPGGFWEWFGSIPNEAQFFFFVFAAFFLCLMIAIVAVTIYKIHKSRLNDALKRELLDRGMSAEEIATVINAKPAKVGTQVEP
jgi:hypothetical protein